MHLIHTYQPTIHHYDKMHLVTFDISYKQDYGGTCMFISSWITHQINFASIHLQMVSVSVTHITKYQCKIGCLSAVTIKVTYPCESSNASHSNLKPSYTQVLYSIFYSECFYKKIRMFRVIK